MLETISISGSMNAWAKRIKRDGVTLWFAGKNPRTPWYAKALGVFVVAYERARIAVSRVDGKLRHLKLKRDSKDGHPFLHVHFVGSQRLLSSFKLNLDGTAWRADMHSPTG